MTYAHASRPSLNGTISRFSLQRDTQMDCSSEGILSSITKDHFLRARVARRDKSGQPLCPGVHGLTNCKCQNWPKPALIWFLCIKIAKKYYYVFSNKSLYLRSQILFLHISTTISVVILVPKIAASTSSSQGDPPHRTSLTLFPNTLSNLQRPWSQWVSLHHPSLHRNEVELSGWMVEFSSLKITFHKNSRNQAPAPKCPCVWASLESV